MMFWRKILCVAICPNFCCQGCVIVLIVVNILSNVQSCLLLWVLIFDGFLWSYLEHRLKVSVVEKKLSERLKSNNDILSIWWMFNHDSWCPACEIIAFGMGDIVELQYSTAVERIEHLSLEYDAYWISGCGVVGWGPVVRLQIKLICGVHCSHWTCDPIRDSDGSSESLNDSIIEM